MTYQQDRKKYYTEKLRELQAQLPPFCTAYFRGIDNSTSVLTRYSYATDLRLFFIYLISKVEIFAGKAIPSLTLDDLNCVTAEHIESFLEDLTLYTKDGIERENDIAAKARKLSSIRSFFKYNYSMGKLNANVASLVLTPKLHKKAIVRLDANEVTNMLDTSLSGKGLSKNQKFFHNATQVRDTAILTLFLGTGIRISELVGIDINDVNFDNNQFVVTRKGGDQSRLSFGEEVRAALLAYIEQRNEIAAYPGSENALFLSLQRKRITVRAVENLVKKYAALASPLKKITPHKLRSTYGTMLYNASNDIYLVADVLGHKDVNTTTKHYAAMSEERRRSAAKLVKLRDDESDDNNKLS